METWVQWLLALGVGGVIGEGFRTLWARKKMGADYADVISASAVRLLAPMEDRINQLQDDLHEAVAEAVTLGTRLHDAMVELEAARGDLTKTKEELAQATQEAHRLAEQLQAAQSEVAMLRVEIAEERERQHGGY